MITRATPPVGLIGEKSVKLASRMVSQKISTARSGVGRPAIRLLEQQNARFRDAAHGLKGLELEVALNVVLRRQPLDGRIDEFTLDARPVGRAGRGLHGPLAPDPIDQRAYRLSLQFTGGPRLRSVALELVVEQDQLRRDLPDLVALCVIGVLGRRDQQAQHQRGERGNQGEAQPDDILRMVVEMVLSASSCAAQHLRPRRPA